MQCTVTHRHAGHRLAGRHTYSERDVRVRQLAARRLRGPPSSPGEGSSAGGCAPRRRPGARQRV